MQWKRRKLDADYMMYRMKERGYEAAKVEEIIRHSAERYTETESGRTVIVGRHDELLVLIRSRWTA